MSSTKMLKIKRIFAWTIYNNLRRTAPKDFPTTGEIKSTISDILPALKTHIAEYQSLIEQAEALSAGVVDKKLSEEEAKVAVDEINNGWRTYNKERGQDVVEISIDDEGIKTLKIQFEREGWGKQWVANIEEFGELLEAFEAVG